MKRDFVKLVEQGYDRIAREYTAWREEEPLLFRAELEDLANRLPPEATVLDAGCGAGVPVTQFLCERFRVIGIDLSDEQLRLARRNVPRATFLHHDMLDLAFAPQSFNAITCFCALIHVPREQHARVLANFHRVLKSNGYLLLITGNEDFLDDVDNFFGAEMYWSHYDRVTSLQMIREAGFEIVWDKVVSDRPKGSHTLGLGRKNVSPVRIRRNRACQ